MHTIVTTGEVNDNWNLTEIKYSEKSSDPKATNGPARFRTIFYALNLKLNDMERHFCHLKL